MANVFHRGQVGLAGIGAGALIAAAILLLGNLSVSGLAKAESVHAGETGAEFLFGFSQAAMTSCDLQPGAGFERLRHQVERAPDGRVPGGVKQGFGAFADIVQSRGVQSACDRAMELLGPEADHYPGALTARR